MAYIDSEIAKRRVAGATTASQNQKPGEKMDITIRGSNTKSTVDVQRQPATLGKLLEIDLGDEARDKNVQRTNMARRRLDGESVEDEEQVKKPGKVRLGRDGKPWRGRKRRGSEDVARDKLVEDILRENRRKSSKHISFSSCKTIVCTDIHTKWKSTTSPSWNPKAQETTPQLMIASLKLSRKNSWMLYLLDKERKWLLHLRQPGVQGARRKRRSSRDQNWEEVGVREQQ
jgi:hypothetical protein